MKVSIIIQKLWAAADTWRPHSQWLSLHLMLQCVGWRGAGGGAGMRWLLRTVIVYHDQFGHMLALHVHRVRNHCRHLSRVVILI